MPSIEYASYGSFGLANPGFDLSGALARNGGSLAFGGFGA